MIKLEGEGRVEEGGKMDLSLSAGVGKTSLVLRHVGNTFSRSVSPTIGASFFTFSM